jgi:2,5-dioxopentanoate dehydrogenase
MPTTETTLTGQSIIAGEQVAGNGRTMNGFDPRTNEVLEPAYTLIDADQLAAATAAA